MRSLVRTHSTGEHTWAMTSACLSGDNAGFVNRSTERGSEFDDVRFSRRLDAVGTGIDTLVSQIPSCNGLDVPQVIQSPVRHSPTNVAFAEGESRSSSSPGGCHGADIARDEFN